MATQVRIGDVDEGTLSRLASKARKDGIRLFRDHSGRYFASSASRPGTFHYVTAVSCDCIGFVTHQRCKHNSALLTALGWTSTTPEPEPPAISTGCPECNGSGTVPATISTGPGKWAYTNETCSVCHGRGTIETAA